METLRGRCACGRNHYVVTLPDQAEDQAQVVLDNSAHARRLQASPLTAFLKIPIPWFQSSTVALFPDETHQTIRRTFSSPDRENLRNQFCGYCGTQLSQWDDSSQESDKFIWLTLGTLLDDDIDKLEELGILDLEETEQELQAARTTSQGESSRGALFKAPQGVIHRGAPWFEDIVQDTKLGRLKRQKGGHTSADGSTTVEWEAMEWTSSGGDEGTLGKRKIDDVEENEKGSSSG